MITLPSEITSTSGTGGMASSANGGDQGFSALLNSKMNDRQQQQPVTSATKNQDKTAARNNPANDQTTAAAQAAQNDKSARQRATQDDDTAGNDADAAASLPAVADTDQDPAAKKTAATKDADPALDSDAAQNLMALLAQTNPTTLPLSTAVSAGQSLAADVGGIPLLGDAATSATAMAASLLGANDPGAADKLTSTTANNTAAANLGADKQATADSAANLSADKQAAADSAADVGANKKAAADGAADVSANSKAAANQAATAADGKATAVQTAALYSQSLDNTANAAKSTVPAALPTGVTKSATAVAIDQQDKNSSATAADAKDQLARTDGDASTVVVTPATQAAVDASQSFSGQNATTVTLKKSGDLAIGSDVSQNGATPVATPTLSAAGSNAAATPAPASALISAQLGSDEWQQAIGQQVVMFSRDGQQNAELRLHPDNLGSVQISMQVDTNNVMQIHLASGHSQVRSALEDALPQLRDSLAQSGINLGQSSVGSDATPNWSGNGQNSSAGRQSGETFSLNAVAGQADNVRVPASPITTGRTAGIDTFV